MKKLFVFIIVALFYSNVLPQTCDSLKNETTFYFGGELDLFPYITGGYYGSVFIGKDQMKYRLIYSRANTPKFVLPDGFDRNKMNVVAFLADYFLDGNVNTAKWWIGAGFEIWKNNVRNENDGAEKKFDNYIFTVGTGYLFYLSRNIYINPWTAFHLKIGGPKEKQIGDNVFKPNLFLPEASLKIGIVF